MKKFIASIIALVLVLTGCSSNDEVIKVGLNGTDSVVWSRVAEIAKEKHDIDIELVFFSDYIQPNLALSQGELDLNSFQTVSFFEESISQNDWDLTPIATTVRAPMGIYSTKHTSVDEIIDGAKIGIPNDGSNRARALLLLVDAGLITLSETPSAEAYTPKDIVDNPHNIEIVELVPNQLARSLDDLDFAVINNGVAVDAGYIPTTDAIYLEPETQSDYINIIVSETEEKDRKEFQQIADIYQSDEIKELIIEDSNGSSIPTFIPLSEIGY